MYYKIDNVLKQEPLPPGSGNFLLTTSIKTVNVTIMPRSREEQFQIRNNAFSLRISVYIIRIYIRIPFPA